MANHVLTISEDGPNVDPIATAAFQLNFMGTFTSVLLSINLANESESPSKPITHKPMDMILIVHGCFHKWQLGASDSNKWPETRNVTSRPTRVARARGKS